MTVSLTQKLEDLVSSKVSSGMYHSAGEVVREALQLLNARDELTQARLRDLKHEIARGIEQADRGKTLPAEEVFQKLRERNAKASAKK